MPLAVSVRTLAKLLVQVLCNAFKSHLPKHKRKEIEMKLSSCSQKSVGIKYESVNKMFVLHVHGHVAVLGASYIVFPFWPLYSCSCSSSFFFSSVAGNYFYFHLLGKFLLLFLLFYLFSIVSLSFLASSRVFLGHEGQWSVTLFVDLIKHNASINFNKECKQRVQMAKDKVNSMCLFWRLKC